MRARACQEADFCACGEYLRWEPTNSLPALGAPSASASDASTSAAASAAENPSLVGARGVDPNVTVAADVVAPAGGGWGSATSAPSASTAPGTGQAPPGAAALILRRPDDDGAFEGVVSVSVEPGGRVTLLGLIRNQSDVVDNFDLAVRGLPEEWWTIAPATVYLVPYGAAGTAARAPRILIVDPSPPGRSRRSRV